MIEFVVGIDRGRGSVGYLSNRESDGSAWVTHDRKRAKGFPNLEVAKAEAHRYIQEALDQDNLFSPGHQAIGLKIETRLNKEAAEQAKGKLSDEEAKGLLEVLKAHYKQPVMPMSDFCEAITTWFRCIEECNREWAEKGEPDRAQGHRYHQHLRTIERDILKSNLLARLLYGGEPLRTRRCPEHDGRWNGSRCAHGCDGTGWLREG